MKVVVEDAGGIREVACRIAPDMVMCGGAWHHGVSVDDTDDWTAEVVGYAINEGHVLADVWDVEDSPLKRFVVSEVSSAELDQLRMMNAKPPIGAKIATEDGFRFTVREDGSLTDGDLEFESLEDLAVGFTLTASLS